MTLGLYREFVLTSPSIWQLVVAFVKANARACIEGKKPLRVTFSTYAKKRSNEQNARLWAYTYKTIADQAWFNGKQYSADVWHEYLGDKFLPKIESEMPDGTLKTRRMSTTDLTVDQMTTYMNEIEVFAAQELGVEWL